MFSLPKQLAVLVSYLSPKCKIVASLPKNNLANLQREDFPQVKKVFGTIYVLNSWVIILNCVTQDCKQFFQGNNLWHNRKPHNEPTLLCFLVKKRKKEKEKAHTHKKHMQKRGKSKKKKDCFMERIVSSNCKFRVGRINVTKAVLERGLSAIIGSSKYEGLFWNEQKLWI